MLIFAITFLMPMALKRVNAATALDVLPGLCASSDYLGNPN
jgi:hypothetical protein